MTARASNATVTHDHVQFDSSNPKFGSHNMVAEDFFVDGGGNKKFFPDYATITIDPADTNFYLNSSNAWTCEFFLRRKNADANNARIILACVGNDVSQDGQVSVSVQANAPSQTGGILRTFSDNVDRTSGTGDFGTAGAYHHIAIVSVGNGSGLRVYFDGTRIVNSTSYTSTETFNTRKFTIGAKDTPGSSNVHNLTDPFHFDELRISNTARYSASTITVPTAAFVDDANTLALLHLNNSFSDSATISASATMSVSAALSSTSALTIDLGNDLAPYTWDTVTPDTWADFPQDRWLFQGVQVNTSAALTATGGLAILASGNLNVSAGNSFDATLLKQAASDLDVVASQSVSGTITRSVSANMAASVNMVTTAQIARAITADLTVLAQQTAQALVDIRATASLNTSVNLSATGRLIKLATLLAENFATINVAGLITRSVGALFTVATGQTATATVVKAATASLPVTVTQTANAQQTLAAAQSVSVTANLATTATLLKNGTAQLATTATVNSAAVILLGNAVPMPVITQLVSTGAISRSIGAVLPVTVSQTAQAAIFRRILGQLQSQAQIQAVIDLVLLDSDFVITVLRETREFELPSETRQQAVLADTRLLPIPSESRIFDLLPETRTLASEDFVNG